MSEKSNLDAQRVHWHAALSSRPQMFGRDPSEAARRSVVDLRAAGARRILELGGGQGRDTIFLAASGFSVHALDYAPASVDAIVRAAEDAGLSDVVTAELHDVRRPLPVEEGSFGACYSHMLFCMALTAAELEALMGEVRRALRPGGVVIYTVRNTSDADYRRGRHRGEAMYESQGFIVHFFDRAMIERLAAGFELMTVDEFEEGKLPRRLFRVVMRRI